MARKLKPKGEQHGHKPDSRSLDGTPPPFMPHPRVISRRPIVQFQCWQHATLRQTGARDAANHSNLKRCDVSTKEALLKAWDETDAQLLEVWKGVTVDRLNAIEADNFWMPEATSNLWKVQYWVDNEIHHRGQGYVYLRALGIEPPAFWER
jgi:uncharacterized damage-inducible protein DinB